jgi:hypothetical protein
MSREQGVKMFANKEHQGMVFEAIGMIIHIAALE